MTRLPPALREKAFKLDNPGMLLAVPDVEAWLYGTEGLVPSTWTPGDPEPEPTPGLVERVEKRIKGMWGPSQQVVLEVLAALQDELEEEP